jgi:DNA-binding NarL/FixJ family response regulator
MEADRGQANVSGRMNGAGQEWTLLLVCSKQLRWAGLKATLYEVERVRVVGEVADSQTALQEAVDLQPRGVIADAATGDGAIVQLARQLKAVSSSSRLILFGEKAQRTILRALYSLNVCSYVLWEEATPETVCHLPRAVLDGGLWVASYQAVNELLGVPAGPSGQSLSDRERLVLRGLARGLSEREIAEAAGLGLRTVERMIPDLEKRLKVDTLYELRLRAHDSGYGA